MFLLQTLQYTSFFYTFCVINCSKAVQIHSVSKTTSEKIIFHYFVLTESAYYMYDRLQYQNINFL